MPKVSRLPEPVVEDNAATRNHTLERLLIPDRPVVNVWVVEPNAPGSLNVPRVVNDVGVAPVPYCRLHVVLRVCTLSICRSMLSEFTVRPEELKLKLNEAPESPKDPVWRTASALSAEANWTVALLEEPALAAAAGLKLPDVLDQSFVVALEEMSVAAVPSALAFAPVRTPQPAGRPEPIELKFCV